MSYHVISYHILDIQLGHFFISCKHRSEQSGRSASTAHTYIRIHVYIRMHAIHVNIKMQRTYIMLLKFCGIGICIDAHAV